MYEDFRKNKFIYEKNRRKVDFNISPQYFNISI